MRFSFYHETSPVKTPFHVRMPPPPALPRNLSTTVWREGHAASFSSRPPLREPQIETACSRPQTPSKLSRRPKFNIYRLSISERETSWYLQKCRCLFLRD